MRADDVRGYTFLPDMQSERVLEFDEGTLIVDVAESGAKRILWRGWARTDVEGLLDDPRAMEKRITESVRRLMVSFPRLAAGGSD